MLRRNDGYFLAELFLSLSTWLLLTGFLLPLVMLVWEQASQLQLENTATHLLYDELERHIAEGVASGSKTIQLNGTAYEVRWSGETSEIEVCVEYKDGKSILYKKCKRPEQ